MRLTSIILLAFGLHAVAGVDAQKVTITGKNLSLKQVFSMLHQQAHYDFIYTDNQLRNAQAVDIDVQGMEVLEVLRRIFIAQPLTYSIEDRTVVVREKEKPVIFYRSEIEPVVVSGPLSGLVLNQRSTPLSGATVVIKRTHGGVTTDVNGLFQLKSVEPNDTLIVSFIGFQTQRVPVAGARFVNIRMEEAHDELDEMVVQAYGHTTQRLTTGSIGRVTAAEIAKQPVGDILLALEARVPGVQVTQSTGYEGSVIKVEIRGRNSLNPGFATQPLYIVDGVPITVLDVAGTASNDNSTTNLSRGIDQTGLSYSTGQSPLYNINPADIQSVEILKDADATAIYGSRGANGVVLITTKRGKPGATQFDLTVSEGVNFITRRWPYLHTREYLQMRREQYRNDGIQPTAALAPDLYLWDSTRYTDWLDYAYGSYGNNTSVQGGLSGGTDLLTFRLSAGYNRTTDITARSGGVSRITVATNVTSTSPNKKLQTSFSANFGSSLTNQIQSNSVMNLPPNAPAPFTRSGALNYAEWDQVKSSVIAFPFASLMQPYQSRANTLNANLSLQYTIVKGLKAGFSVGYNNMQNIQQKYNPIASQDPNSTTKPTGSADFGNTRANNWIVEPQATYSTLFKRARIDLLAGGTIQNNVTDGLLVTGNKYTSDIFIRSISLAPSVTSTDNYGQYKYAGIFGRATVNWDSKYILNLNVRRDGSSRFGPGNQFGNFGSLGAAWLISNENWAKVILPEAVDFLKLRGSYGTTGSDAIGDYQYLSQWGNSSPNLPTYDSVTSLLPQIQPNDNFHWQVNKKLEAALDMELFHSFVMMEVSVYRNRCNNQLVNYATPEFTGFTTVVANRPANVQNQGIEISLSGNLIRKKDLFLVVNFNMGINRDKLLDYPDIAVSPWRNQYKVGQSLNLAYAFHYLGIDPLTGKYSYEDHNHDGKIQAPGTVFPGTGIDDRYIVLDRTSKYSGGFGSMLGYKGFMVSVQFSYSRELGQNMLSPGTAGSVTGLTNWGQYLFDHRWRYVGQQDAKFAGATTSIISEFGNSDAGYSNASFLRFQSLSFSYTLSGSKWKHKIIKAMSFNVNTHDLWVITSFKGMDPQLKSGYIGHPLTRTITSGLNFSF